MPFNPRQTLLSDFTVVRSVMPGSLVESVICNTRDTLRNVVLPSMNIQAPTLPSTHKEVDARCSTGHGHIQCFSLPDEGRWRCRTVQAIVSTKGIDVTYQLEDVGHWSSRHMARGARHRPTKAFFVEEETEPGSSESSAGSSVEFPVETLEGSPVRYSK